MAFSPGFPLRLVSESKAILREQDDWLIFAKEIQEHLKQHGSFSLSFSAFRRALDKSEIEHPPGQSAHVLRHTFTSHFVMIDGEVLTFRKLMGHSTLNMTMRYAHLAPNFFQQSVRLKALISAAIYQVL